MGIRYQKRINLLGNLLRLNISKSGVGISAGVRGARISKGPGGTFISVGLPGTGLYYRKRIGSSSGKWASFLPGGGDEAAKTSKKRQLKAAAAEEAAPPRPPEPGFFASGHEKAFARGVEAYLADDDATALPHFMEASEEEPGAAILAAVILADQPSPMDQSRAVYLLETLAQTETRTEFPTPLMQKYLGDTRLDIEITPDVTAAVPIDGLAVSLLLVELYQVNNRLEDAIALLEEVDDLADEPVVTLSLCELYTVVEFWDGIIERAGHIERPENDVELETRLYYGQAMQAKGLHEAAITVFTGAMRRKKGFNPDILNACRFWRALSYLETGKKSRGRSELEKLYAIAPQLQASIEPLLNP